jgi:excisionase family DNA binding protein
VKKKQAVTEALTLATQRAVTEALTLAISADEFATALNVDRRTVIRRIDAGDIRAIKFGKVLRIPRGELERVLAGDSRKAG